MIVETWEHGDITTVHQSSVSWNHLAIQRTRDYVECHSQLHFSDTMPPDLKPFTPSLLPHIKHDVQSEIKEQIPKVYSTLSAQ